ncbi:MAG TPA: hypothetical protein VFW33_00425, partial [Gemmataceae bacterium]|nr:hypothetical protein [Gemmataceae bacterium]
MPLTTVTLTGNFEDGANNPLSGTAVFTPTSTVYSSGIPVLQPDVPVQAEIVAGQLRSASGAPLTLVATDNAGLSPEGMTGWWAWSVVLTIAGQVQPAWSFFLPSSPSSRDLFSLANTPASGTGVASVTAGDTSVVIGGTATAPTVETGTLDVIASDHPPAANWSNNSKKITS